MTRRTFYWGVTCLGVGHVTRLAVVAYGTTSPRSLPGSTDRCFCGSRFELPTGVAAYDAMTHDTVSEDELRQAWRGDREEATVPAVRRRRPAAVRLPPEARDILERIARHDALTISGALERSLSQENRRRRRSELSGD